MQEVVQLFISIVMLICLFSIALKLKKLEIEDEIRKKLLFPVFIGAVALLGLLLTI